MRQAGGVRRRQFTEDDSPDDILIRNQAFILPGEHAYNTPLSGPDERAFRQWVAEHKVAFDANAHVSDYDMRGFWQAMMRGDPLAFVKVDENDKRAHYPDFWKTPLDATFSRESQWANPKTAPFWNDQDQLVTPEGEVLFDDRAQRKATK